MTSNCTDETDKIEQSLSLFHQVAYILVFVVGLPLNVSTLWFFYRIRLWTDTHIYMFNLMLADFLLILFLPFRIFEAFHQITLSKFCTFLICVHYSNMYVSIFTITAISAHRFIVIRFPFLTKALEARRKIIAQIVCALIWVTVMAICSGFYNNLTKDKLYKCYERKWDKKLSLQFLLVLEIMGYLLPIVIITTCSTQAIHTLLKSTEDKLQHAPKTDVMDRKRVVAIITANMITFIVCFTPVHVGYLLRFLSTNCQHATFSHAFYEVSEFVATTNCCLDVVGYYFLLKKVFRANR